MPNPYFVLGSSSLSIMPGDTQELWVHGDGSPTPVLRRAPLLLNSHGEPIRGIMETLGSVSSDVPPSSSESEARDGDAPTGNGNLRRSISHRISRVTTTKLARSLSGSLHGRTRSASASVAQRRAQGGELLTVGYQRNDVQIRKVSSKESTRPVFGGGTMNIALSSVHNADSDSARASELCMHTESVDLQNARPLAEVPVPALLQQGVLMTKVSAKSQKSYMFKLDADQGQIIWESKRLRISMCPSDWMGQGLSAHVRPLARQFPSRTSRSSGRDPMRGIIASNFSSHASTRIDGSPSFTCSTDNTRRSI